MSVHYVDPTFGGVFIMPKALPEKTLYQVHAPHLCAGIEVDGCGRVTLAAPILHYMTGWPVAAVVEYCKRKGWVLASARQP